MVNITTTRIKNRKNKIILHILTLKTGVGGQAQELRLWEGSVLKAESRVRINFLIVEKVVEKQLIVLQKKSFRVGLTLARSHIFLALQHNLNLCNSEKKAKSFVQITIFCAT